MIDILTYIINNNRLKDVTNLFLIEKRSTQTFLNKLNYNFPNFSNHQVTFIIPENRPINYDPKSAYIDLIIQLDLMMETINNNLDNYTFTNLTRYDMVTVNGYNFIFDGFNFINIRYGLPNYIRIFEHVPVDYWLNYDVNVNFDHHPYLDQLKANLTDKTYFVKDQDTYEIIFYDLNMFLAALDQRYLQLTVESKYRLKF